MPEDSAIIGTILKIYVFNPEFSRNQLGVKLSFDFDNHLTSED